MDFKILQKIDENGYWIKPWKFFIQEGTFPSKKMIETPLPEGADPVKAFYRWDGEKWNEELKPTCAADLVGVVVSHQSQTAHDQEMRELVQKYGQEDGYRIKRGDALEWIVEEIPQEEIEAQAIDAELSAFDQQISSLKDRMATAMLQGDDEMVAELKAEYATLMGA